MLFSDRAIYVIVFSLRAQSLSTAELTRHVMNVSVRCKDAPILIVGTHADVVGGGGASVSLATLKQRFPQVCVLAPLPPPFPSYPPVDPPRPTLKPASCCSCTSGIVTSLSGLSRGCCVTVLLHGVS